MRVVTKMTFDTDVIEVPDFVGSELQKYQEKFDEWLYDKCIDHPYWTYKNGKKYGVCFRGDAFVYWLNNYELKGSEYRANVIDSFVKEYDENLNTLYF
ncbi:MAG: hypothetical protein ACI4QV_04275 [Acutalibacteraceae bacterium]